MAFLVNGKNKKHASEPSFAVLRVYIRQNSFIWSCRRPTRNPTTEGGCSSAYAAVKVLVVSTMIICGKKKRDRVLSCAAPIDLVGLVMASLSSAYLSSQIHEMHLIIYLLKFHFYYWSFVILPVRRRMLMAFHK